MSYGGFPKDYNPWSTEKNMVSDKINENFKESRAGLARATIE